MQISKSEYMQFLKHPVLIWLKKHDKKKLPPVDDNLQAVFDAGNLFESYAEKLFEGGEKIGFDSYDEYLSLPARTTAAIERGVKTLFQARFETPTITCITDVIEFVDEKELDLYEIKSGTSVKDEHIFDLAFQTHVLQSCGFKVRNVYVVNANSQFVRRGEIKVRELCIVTDVTDDVKAEVPDTIELIDEAHEVLKQRKMPDLSPPDEDGNISAWLEIYLHLNPQKPGSIFDLCWPKNRVAQLFSMGIENLVDIPDDFKLAPKQRMQVEAAKKDEQYLELESIKEFVERLEFPLYFLDYETLSSIIPPFDGLSPYNQLPFQYSLHVMETPESELQHFTYLHRENSDPTVPLSESLSEHIGDSGTILTWNESFEKGCNLLMGKIAPKYKKFYSQINDRIDDLCIPFQKNWYVDKGFMGSYSIKKVLPVLVPELSYKDLGINEGAAAQRLWMQSVLDGKLANRREKILDDLDKYCELDTLAMVEIYNCLVELVSEDYKNAGKEKKNVQEEVAEKLSLF